MNRPTSFRIDTKLWRQLQILAKKRHRTVSAELAVAIERHLAEVQKEESP